MVPGIKKTAYRVGLATWKIFTGITSATLTLNGDGLPTESFLCAVTPISVAGHTDVVGSVTIGSETITFAAATRKTTTVPLSALPTITTSALDCNLLIEALDLGATPLMKETLTSIKIGFKQTQKVYQDRFGKPAMSSAEAKTQDTNCVAGTILRIDGTDYSIEQVSPKTKMSGVEYLRKMILAQLQ
jgi:hypothetical protein